MSDKALPEQTTVNEQRKALGLAPVASGDEPSLLVGRKGNIYLGNPCKRGHIGWRYVGNRTCIECYKDAASQHFYPKMSSEQTTNVSERLQCRRQGMVEEIAQCEKVLFALRAQLTGIDEVIAHLRGWCR